MKNPFIITLVVSLLATLSVANLPAQDNAENPADADKHSQEKAGEHADAGAVNMPLAERTAQGVRTALVTSQAITGAVLAPGEVRMNAYRSAQVTPRISAQIVARHTRLGDRVTEGQRLVTLSSVEMAKAQGELLEADREWQRVRKLGREVIAAKRYLAAEVERQRAKATVAAYGMTDKQIAALLGGDAARASGTFDLLSPQDGTIVSDKFILGELAEPGRLLLEISDESVLWVETQLSPQDAAKVTVGTPVRIGANDTDWVNGKVIQLHHRLDETTRTQSLRIEVDNREDRLHPGQFVQVSVPTTGAEQVLAVPKEAIVLMQGKPTVFKVEGDVLRPQPVDTGITRGGYTEIKGGLSKEQEVVVQGVFLLKSLLLKSEMGEGH